VGVLPINDAAFPSLAKLGSAATGGGGKRLLLLRKALVVLTSYAETPSRVGASFVTTWLEPIARAATIS
jgi:hypothetical protein